MWLVFVLVLVAGIGGKEVTDEEYAQFPRLFHLDDYESCLLRRGGVYCLGDFELSAREPGEAIFNNLVEYSKNPLHFNRTEIHRGYCVSSRCPLELSERAENAERAEKAEAFQAERNASYRFERCVQHWAHSRGLQTTTKAIQYCHTTEEWKTRTIEIDNKKIAFAIVVFVILFLNVAGTAYDLVTPDDEKKNEVMVAFSVRANWRKLTFRHDENSSLAALDPAQGIRVVVMISVITIHVAALHYTLYTHNVRDFENMMKSPILMIVRNGTSIVQLFLVLSSFLLGHRLLLHSKTHPLSLTLLPKCILHRFFRITPVHLLVVGFVASWLPALGQGPMWPVVEAGGASCARKFWTHAVFLNNFLDPADICLTPTWFLAVDFQLCVVGSTVMLLLPRRPLPVLGSLLAASVIANGALAYYYQFRPTLFYVIPNDARFLLSEVPMFYYYYIMPWGNLPACLIGLFLAHLHFQLQEKGFKASEHKWLVWLCTACIPTGAALFMSGLMMESISSRLGLAVAVALERPLLCLLAAVFMFGSFNGVQYFPRRVFACRFWIPLGRLMLPVMLLHWVLSLSLLASSSVPLHHSVYNLLWESTGAVVLTHLLSVPLTVMVESPVQRIAAYLLR